MSDDYNTYPDLEVVALRKKVKELEQKLAEAQAVLRENDLLDAKSHISDEEHIITSQIRKFRELSDKNVPFENDDFKNLDILVKALLAIRGKTIAPEPKAKKKKEEAPDIGKLLKIAEGKE